MKSEQTHYSMDLLNSFRFACLLLFMTAVPFLMSGCAKNKPIDNASMDIPLLEQWSGDYPVSGLGKLPEGQQDIAAGYIGNAATFVPVWRLFMPKEMLPPIDFSKNIAVFSRNVQFYNRTSIFKVTLQGGTAEIMAMETMSAMPIEEKVAMAIAVIPREGITSIQAGTEKIQVMPYK